MGEEERRREGGEEEESWSAREQTTRMDPETRLGEFKLTAG